ncbi:MAG: hypothetical protein ACKO8T_02635 [Actinomycetota bacterium]
MTAVQRLVTPFLIVVCVGIAAMWVYAFGFASKESVNRIGDPQWQQYAESRCASAKEERIALADMRKVNEVGPEALRERALIVDKATDTLQRAIDDISAQPIADAKGRAIVPLWLADYRTYIADRRSYADDLRAGINEPFAETKVEGIPISEKISTFAADNLMKSCGAPIDLSV